MNLIEYCPNPDCRTRLEITEPIPARVICPRCHGTVNLSKGANQVGGLLVEFVESQVSRPPRRSPLNPPVWIWLLILFSFFACSVSVALIVINFRHLGRLDSNRAGGEKNAPFFLNIRFRPEEKGFAGKPAEAKGGWFQKWIREEDNVTLFLGAMDFGKSEPEKEEMDGLVGGKLDALFNPSSFQVVTRKKETTGSIGGEKVLGEWSVQVSSLGEPEASVEGGKKGEALARFGVISLVARRGYLYWFLVLGSDLVVERGNWWGGVEFGNEREGWNPPPVQEIKVSALGRDLFLDPATWRVMSDKERIDYFQFQQPEVGGKDKKGSGLDFKSIVQGRKRKSTSLDGGLKTSAVLFAVKSESMGGDLAAYRGLWEKWRAKQSPEGTDPPEIKLMPITGQDGFFRSVVNGESEDYLVICPLPSDKGAWIASCLYPDREEWAGEFARIKRRVSEPMRP